MVCLQAPWCSTQVKPLGPAQREQQAPESKTWLGASCDIAASNSVCSPVQDRRHQSEGSEYMYCNASAFSPLACVVVPAMLIPCSVRYCLNIALATPCFLVQIFSNGHLRLFLCSMNLCRCYRTFSLIALRNEILGGVAWGTTSTSSSSSHCAVESCLVHGGGCVCYGKSLCETCQALLFIVTCKLHSIWDFVLLQACLLSLFSTK